MRSIYAPIAIVLVAGFAGLSAAHAADHENNSVSITKEGGVTVYRNHIIASPKTTGHNAENCNHARHDKPHNGVTYTIPLTLGVARAIDHKRYVDRALFQNYTGWYRMYHGRRYPF